MMRISYPSELNSILVLIVIIAWRTRMLRKHHDIGMRVH